MLTGSLASPQLVGDRYAHDLPQSVHGDHVYLVPPVVVMDWVEGPEGVQNLWQGKTGAEEDELSLCMFDVRQAGCDVPQ